MNQNAWCGSGEARQRNVSETVPRAGSAPLFLRCAPPAWLQPAVLLRGRSWHTPVCAGARCMHFVRRQENTRAMAARAPAWISFFFSRLVRVFGMALASSGDLAPSVGHGWRLVYSCCPPCADCLGWGWGFDVAVLLLLTQRAPALVQQVYCHVGYQLIAMFSAM